MLIHYMNNNIRYVSLGILFLFFSTTIIGQKAIGNQDPEVKVIASATKNSIKLRWAVNTPSAWKHANTYGFTIERRTITQNGEILKAPIIKKITPAPIQPKPLLDWEVLAATNDNAAIAAQAIYGNDFDVEMEDEGNAFMSIINQARGLEQRFSFALFAADQDYKVAEYSGLAYTDTDVKPNERYLYRIYTSIPKEKMEVKFGGIFIGLDDYKDLPKPIDFVGAFKDKNTLLSWNAKLLKDQYSSYTIERSDDQGNTFKALSSTPVINFSGGDEEKNDRMFYMDSLPANNKMYQYRLKGRSMFGEEGPYSKIVSGSGKLAFVYNPSIKEATLLKNNTAVVISWEFPDAGKATLSHFELTRANELKGNYEVVQSNIAKDVRMLSFNTSEPINYYKIVAVDSYGTKRASFPKVIQLDDNTPPETPYGLTGVIDTTGIVKLTWKQNTESDFLGYRVFKANLDNEEFSQITFRPTPKSIFTDTVNIKTLNTHVYYKVQAFDKRYNPSDFSEIISIKRPDVIPPRAPVFTPYQMDKEQAVVQLNWIVSSSADAKTTVVYRKEQGGTTDWELLSKIPLPLNYYTDTSAATNTNYLYTLLTVDSSGLESAPINPITIRIPDNGKKQPIDKFLALANRELNKIDLNWKYKVPNVKTFKLYRGTETEAPTLYKILEGNTHSFMDTDLTVNTKYTYMLQGVLTTNATSPLKKIQIEY